MIVTARPRLKIGELDIAAIDPHLRDTQYIYDEIYDRQIYRHPNFVIPERGVIFDVGANIGLFSIWAARHYRPASIHAFEASPLTYTYLTDNIARNVDAGSTTVRCINRAVSNEADQELVLHQAPFTSGISTLLDEKDVPWVRELRDSGELTSHKTTTTTLSREIASAGIARIDLLKIDVEGHFLEVLAGLEPADFARVRNIVLEADYLEALGETEDSICAMLAAKGYATHAHEQTIYAWRA